MHLELPDEIIHRAETNAVELRAALAVVLYADNRIDYADACELAGLSGEQFNRELILRRLSIQQYPDKSLAQETRLPTA